MKVMMTLLFLSFSFSACAQQSQQVAIWSYFLKQCEDEGISRNDQNAMAGCILLKERQTVPQSSQFGNILQGMGATLNPQVYQGFITSPGQQCHTTPDYAGGYRTVCQ